MPWEITYAMDIHKMATLSCFSKFLEASMLRMALLAKNSSRLLIGIHYNNRNSTLQKS